MKIVEVIWNDACSYDDISKNEIERIELTKIVTVGYLLKEDKNIVVIAFQKDYCVEFFDNEKGIRKFRKVLAIPKPQIIEIRTIEENKDEKESIEREV